MSAPPANDPGIPVENKQQLVDFIASGCKPPEAWRIGTEHEKFAFDLKTLRPLPYDGTPGIRALLEGMTRFGWTPHLEDGKPIALTMDGQSVTLEPGGQFELSGAPLETIHETCIEVNDHLKQVKEVGAEIGSGMLGLGFNPKWRRADVPMMPKGRYGIMSAYMPKMGSLGLDMMLRTCTVQVNLDFASEADMVKKFRVSLALQPIATALFANSPFTEGKPNGFMSYRSHVWTDTDPDRCGILPFVFEDGMSFERYADHVLDVPMYFIYRDGTYLDTSGQSFRDFLDGKLPALPGEKPTLRDWEDHMTTLFPEVRMKRFLEMRGADGGPWGRLCALPAFWVGLLYSQSALDAAWDLVKDFTLEEHQQLRDDVPKLALKTPFRGGTVGDLAGQVLALARAGLRDRARLDGAGSDESGFLDPLFDIQRAGQAPAEALLQRYAEAWDGSVDPVFTEQAY
ncbi:MAG: glutamate--cysteine ligase [Proteobacteria bacterium]|nr:glutamate--cysteine ligase [Pseudomonadota bacterium]